MERKGREAPLLHIEHDVVTRSIVACRTSNGHRSSISSHGHHRSSISSHSLFRFVFRWRKQLKRLAVHLGLPAVHPALNPVPCGSWIPRAKPAPHQTLTDQARGPIPSLPSLLRIYDQKTRRLPSMRIPNRTEDLEKAVMPLEIAAWEKEIWIPYMKMKIK